MSEKPLGYSDGYDLGFVVGRGVGFKAGYLVGSFVGVAGTLLLLLVAGAVNFA